MRARRADGPVLIQLAAVSAIRRVFNAYGYAGNDPMNFVDPSGLLESWNRYVDGMPVSCSMAISLINMGAARVQGGAGFYLEGRLLVFDTITREHRGYTYWNAFLMDPIP